MENDLVGEIKKWAARLDGALLKTSAIDEKGRKMLSNIKAYGRDSKHFFGRGGTDQELRMSDLGLGAARDREGA